MTNNEIEIRTGDLDSPVSLPSTSKFKRFLTEAPFVLGLLLVNTAAVWGQANWAAEHVADKEWSDPIKWVFGIMLALTVEIIGIFLSMEAHKALLANQSAGQLKLGSYLIGLVAGALNYAHYTPHNPVQHFTAPAITFALLSTLSPWLWAIRSRSMHRAKLAELGLIDPRGVKLSTFRKFWHPIKSLKVIRWAAWSGVNKPVQAVQGWEQANATPVLMYTPEDHDNDTTEVTETIVTTHTRTAKVTGLTGTRAAQIEAVKEAFPDWPRTAVPLAFIKETLGITGQATAQKVRTAIKDEAASLNPDVWEGTVIEAGGVK